MYIQENNVFNSDVQKVQRLLNLLLQKSDFRGKWPTLKEDGYLGPITKNAITTFQSLSKNVNNKSGILDDSTYIALQKAVPSISTAPPYSIMDHVRTNSMIAKDIIYNSFRQKYETLFTSVMDELTDDTRIMSTKFMKSFVNNKVSKTAFFKDLARSCTKVLRSYKIISSEDIHKLREDIHKLEKSKVGSNEHKIRQHEKKIGQHEKKIGKIIRRIKASNVVHPHQIAKRAMNLLSKTANRAIKWSSVILDTCELINYLTKPHNQIEQDNRLSQLFGKIVDDIILVIIGILIGAGLTALGLGSAPVWVAILASVAIGLTLDFLYRLFCEGIGGDESKPFSLSLYEIINTNLTWIDSPQCQKFLQPHEAYISAPSVKQTYISAPSVKQTFISAAPVKQTYIYAAPHK